MKKPQMALRFMPLFYTGVLPRTENGEQGIGSNVVPNVANRRLHSLSFWSLFCGLAYRAILQAMDELFPERPALLFDFMLPSGFLRCPGVLPDQLVPIVVCCLRRTALFALPS